MVSRKRGQNTAGAAAAFIALIAGFILLYILLIPPELRDELLNEGSGVDVSTPGGLSSFSGTNSSVLDESPGRIDYLKFGEYEHPLPAVNLYTTTSSKEDLIGDSLYIKNGVFDRVSKNISFNLPDTRLVDNVYLNFKLNQNRNNQGRLIIALNNNPIYERELGKVGQASPIILPMKYLKEHNVLTFSVSSVGWMFWTTNDYELDQIKVFFDETDISQQRSKNSFMVTDAEKFNLEKGTLKFNPECNPNDAGILNARVNNHIVFSAIPDCGQLNIVELSASVLEAGNNVLIFDTEKGKYLIDQIVVETSLNQMSFPVYYFDLDNRIFNLYEEDDDAECGDVDGECPAGCPEYLDRDCCLQETSKYWCDVKTDNVNDRCRSVLYMSDCNSCPSGYEDEDGDPAEACEDMCGDDTDNECPSGCSKFYDEDCCFEESDENYWCADVPTYGLSNVCRSGIHLEDCDDCSSGYETEDGDFRCPNSASTRDEKAMLKTKYDVKLKMSFLDDGERKAARVFVNGYQFYMDTTKDEYERKIDDYVEDGSNAIKVEPDRGSLDIIKLKVEVEEAR